MSNYVKISTIGARPYPLSLDIELDEAVEKMIWHWKAELQQVLPDKPDLILVPEACDRPPNYPMDKRLAYYRARGDKILDFFVQVAKDNNCYIAYSAAREVDDGTWRNSTRIIDRSGAVVGTYNKNHLVISETTQGGILCGKDAPIIECDFGRVACAICFDLNFDELRLKYVDAKPDLLLFSSMYHGGLMQNYWAYSCRAHFVGAVAGLPSSIISPVGMEIASSTNYFNYVTATVNLDCSVVHLDHNRPRFRAMREKYKDKVKVVDPGYLGAVLISSETDEFTIKDMIEEFEIEELDDYMARSLAHRHDPKNMEP
jgi:predicted amidohydrolase